MKRWEAVETVAKKIDGMLTVACNGMLGRDFWSTGDRPERFYMIGSMGLASAIGLGLAVTQPEKPVVVLDGDGNVLMNMGGLANIGVIGPKNYYHFVFDNGTHSSTGGQKTIAGDVVLEEVAKVCGYKLTYRADDLESVAKATDEMLAGEGPAMLLMKVDPGNQKDVGRVEVTPEDLATRMRVAATGTKP